MCGLPIIIVNCCNVGNTRACLIVSGEWYNRLSIFTLCIILCLGLIVGRDSSVGIATRCGLDGLGIESLWPSDLRQGSAVNRLLGLRVRIPPGAWMFVLCVVRKGKLMDSQNKDTSADEAQTTKECKKKKKSSGSRFSAPAQTGPRVHPASYRIVPALFQGGKVAGAWC